MPWYGLTMQKQFTNAAAFVWAGTGVTAQKCSLHTATYAPDYDLHDFFNDVTNEVTGTNYTAGGVALGSPTSTYDTATDETRLDAADAVWTTATIASIRYALVYNSTPGTAATNPVISLYDLGAQSVTAATFTVQWDATGVVKIDTT